MTGGASGILYSGSSSSGLSVTLSDAASEAILVKASAEGKDYFLLINGETLTRASFERNDQSYERLVQSAALDTLLDGSLGLCATLEGLRIRPKVLPQGQHVKDYFAALKAGDAPFQSFLNEALVKLCAAKPVGLDAVQFLGEYLLKNNPNLPRVEVPTD